MELFGGMADMHGERLPLSYLFVVTDTDAPPHTKEEILVNWMGALKSRGINPEFTLSDKDPLEINALGRVWSKANFYDVRELLTPERRAIAPEPEVLGNHSWLARMPGMPVGPNAPAVSHLPVRVIYI